MQRILPKIALSLVLIVMVAFLFGSTASTQRAFAAYHTSITATSAPLVSCPATISQGSQGAAVVTLQRALNELRNDFDDPSFWENSPQNAHPPLSVDGIFGSNTHAAVIDFQFWNSLAQDGIVGPATWHALHKC